MESEHLSQFVPTLLRKNTAIPPQRYDVTYFLIPSTLLREVTCVASLSSDPALPVYHLPSPRRLRSVYSSTAAAVPTCSQHPVPSVRSRRLFGGDEMCCQSQPPTNHRPLMDLERRRSGLRHGSVGYGTARHSTARHDTVRHGTARHGHVGYGTAQHDTAQHGTARHGTAWHGTAQHDTTQHGTARHGTVLHCTARHGLVGYGTAQHGAVQHGTIRYGTARHGTTRHGTARHSMTRYNTARHGTA